MKPIWILPGLLLAAIAAAQDPIINPQARVSVDSLCKSGSETTGAATTDGTEIVAGFADFRTNGTIRTSFGVSSNGGLTWSHIVVQPPLGFDASTEADPMTAYDPRTNTLFVGGISAAQCIYVAKKIPGQNAFGPSTIARISSWPDKGWMAAGPRPGVPDSTRLYITYNEGVIWSDDMGSTWTQPLSLGVGAGFLPRIGPNGQLYVTYWDGYWGIKFIRSYDGGQTWSEPVEAGTRLQAWGVVNYGIPGKFRDYTNSTMAVNPVNGDIVIIWFDQTNIVGGQKNLDLYMVRSTDQGTTWTDAVRLPFRPLSQISDMIFPWLEFSKEGRLHLMAMDTSYNPGQLDGGSHGLWDEVYYYSDDSGANWSSSHRLTPSSWDSINDGSGINFLGDYQGMAISDKSIFPVYPDTHTGQAEVYVNNIFSPAIQPSTFVLNPGILAGGDLTSLFLVDGSSVIGTRDFGGDRTYPIQLETSAQVSTLNPASLKVSVTASGTLGFTETISVFNVTTSAWDVIDVRPITASESTAISAVGNPANYIMPLTGSVRWRVTFRTNVPITGRKFKASINQSILLVVP